MDIFNILPTSVFLEKNNVNMPDATGFATRILGCIIFTLWGGQKYGTLDGFGKIWA